MNGIKSLDDFLLQGKSTGKRWASGTVQAGTTIHVPTLYNGQQYENSAYEIIVSGLPFPPRIIIAKDISNFLINEGYAVVYYADMFAPNAPILYLLSSNPFKLDNNYNVTNDGFTLPVSGASDEYSWLAIE